MSQGTLKAECKQETGANENAARDALQDARKSGNVHPSWLKQGAPKLVDKMGEKLDDE